MSLPPLSVNLRALRKARGMTQLELADACGDGVWQGTVSAIERGNRAGPAQAVEAMAGVLGVTADVLRSAVSCENCGGDPPGGPIAGFICQMCGTAGKAADGSVAV
jgi:transcriptional regulator with XRE-family HTH domain